MKNHEILSLILKKLILTKPFYGYFSIELNRVFTNKVDIAAVSLDGINPVLLINPDTFFKFEFEQQSTIIEHELNHIVFNHLVLTHKFKDKVRFNIAADLEVNCYLNINNLPEGALHPKNYNLPEKKGTAWYYNNMPDELQGCKISLDIISGKNSKNKSEVRMSEAMGKLVMKQIEGLMKKANSKSRGLAPSHIKEIISNFKTESKFNWRAYLRRFVNSSLDIYSKKTRKRESLRFKDSMGKRIKYKSNILVGIDTSGSVRQEELKEFFNELYHMSKLGYTIDVAQFDADISDIRNINKLLKEPHIKGRGGTDFIPVCEYYNNHKEYDCLIIFTDGEAPKPDNYPKRPLLWILSSNSEVNKELNPCIILPK